MRDFNFELFGTSVVGERGQIVIPAEARRQLKISSGDKFVFFGNDSIIHMIEADKLNDFFDNIHQKMTSRIAKIKDRLRNGEGDDK